MRKITIDDFTGGRNSLDAQNLIKANQHYSGDSVWCEFKALTKRRGNSAVSFALSQPVQLFSTNMAASGLGRLCIIGWSGSPDGRISITDNGNTFSSPGYNVGTCSTTNGSAVVTGSGTAWTTHVGVGDVLSVGTVDISILTVDSATQITLSANAGQTNTNQAYVIRKKIITDGIVGLSLFDLSGAANLYMVDGTNRYRYDGTTIFNVAAMPAFKRIISHKNYMFGIGHNSTDIRWCDLKDPATWPSNNFQTITTAANPTRALAIYGDHILIFCRGGIYRLLGDVFDPSNPSYVLENISTPPNFNFQYSRTIAIHGGILKFLAADGFYAYTGGPSIEKISQAIQPDIDNIYKLGEQAESRAITAAAIVYKNRYFCSVRDTTVTGSYPNTIIVHDERGAWWRWSAGASGDPNWIADWAAIQYGAAGSYLLQGAAGGNQALLTMDSGYSLLSDPLGSQKGIPASWTSKEFDFGNEAEFVEAIITMAKQSAGNITFSVSIDRAIQIDFTCSMTAGVGTVIQKRIPIGRMGKTIRLIVANATAEQNFEIYRIELVYFPTEAVRI